MRAASCIVKRVLRAAYQDLVDLACTVHLENEEKPHSQQHSPDPHNPESGLASPPIRSSLFCSYVRCRSSYVYVAGTRTP
jgi:hypothetical protein